MSWSGSFDHAAAAAARNPASERVEMYTGHLSQRYSPPLMTTNSTWSSRHPNLPRHHELSNLKLQLPTQSSQWQAPGTGALLPPVSALEMLADTKDCQYMMSGCNSPVEPYIKQQVQSPCISPISPVDSATSSMFGRAGSKRPSEGPSDDRYAQAEYVKRRKAIAPGQAKSACKGSFELNERVSNLQEPFRKTHKIKSESSTTGQECNVIGDSKTKHNRAQADLRADKAVQKMEVQHLLMLFGFRGDKLQSTSNARSSGLIWEDMDLLRGVGQALSLALVVLQGMFGEEGMQLLGECLESFEPADFETIKARLDQAKPNAAMLQGLSDMDKKKVNRDMRDRVRVEIMEETSAPLELKGAKGAGEVAQLVQEKLWPLANANGKAFFDRMGRDKAQAKL